MINEENLTPEIKKIVFEQLPDILEKHPDVKLILWKKLVDSFADRRETESRFDILLQEIRELRKESEKKWEQSEKRWMELKEESDERWETLLKEIRRVDKRIDKTIGALGARWGLNTEEAFRSAIKDILKELTDMEVTRYLSYDKEGEVFGHPDQVELDVVVKNGKIYVIEIKSSVSKADMYIFDKKVKFYEEKEGKKVDRKVVISPMIEPKAYAVAKRLGIDTYMEPEDMVEKHGDIDLQK